MLKQLSQLALETDGRYATEQELQFLKNYLQSIDKRISAYEKIRDAEEEIMDQLKAQMNASNSDLFNQGSKDLSSIWRRDVGVVLRCSTAAMLINDLDRLRENLLLWHRTIVTAHKMVPISQVTHEVAPKVIKQFLNQEEAELMMPTLQLNQNILS